MSNLILSRYTIPFEYNSIQKIDGIDLIQTYKNDEKETEIYSKDLKKITSLQNATMTKTADYIKIYNDTDVKYIS